MCFSYAPICKNIFSSTQYFIFFNVLENIYKKYRFLILIYFIIYAKFIKIATGAYFLAN